MVGRLFSSLGVLAFWKSLACIVLDRQHSFAVALRVLASIVVVGQCNINVSDIFSSWAVHSLVYLLIRSDLGIIVIFVAQR